MKISDLSGAELCVLLDLVRDRFVQLADYDSAAAVRDALVKCHRNTESLLGQQLLEDALRKNDPSS